MASGNIGTSAKKLKTVTAQTAAGIVATFGGDVYTSGAIGLTGANAAAAFTFSGDVAASAITLATNGTINFAAGKNVTAPMTTAAGVGTINFAGTSTVTGNIGADGANQFLAVNVNAGTVTLADNLAAITTTVAAGATLKTDGAAALDGLIANSGTLDLGGTLTVTDGGLITDLGAAANASIKLAKASAYTGSVVIDAATGTEDINATNQVTVVPHASFTSGALTLVNTNAGGGTADDIAKYTTTATNGLATYAFTLSSNDVIITATQKAAATVASEITVSSQEASALLAGVNATASDATVTEAYNTAIQAGGTAAQTAAAQSQQETVGQATQAMATAARGMAGTVSTRLSSARTGSQVAGLSQTGMAAGDMARRNTGWSKAFGTFADQDARDGVAGYESDTYGIAFGVDRAINEKTRLGLAVSYANSDIDGKGLGKTKTDVDSYQVAFYGSYEPGRYFVEGQLAYAYNDVDAERTVNFGGLDRKAKGNYDAHQISAKAAVGMPLTSGRFKFVPKAELFYSHSNADGFTETGAGAMNLVVDSGNSSILEGSLGTSVSFDKKLRNGTLTPELRAAVMYEFLDDDAASTSKFTGATTTFNTKGLQPAQFGTKLGLGAGYAASNGKWDVRFDYDAELREDYVGHGGMLTGRIHF